MQTENTTAYSQHLYKQGRTLTLFFSALAFLCVVLFILSVLFTLSSPRIPEEGVQLKIEQGMSLQQIAQEAKDAGVVRSATFLYVVFLYLYDPTSVYAGVYTFHTPQSVFEVAKKLSERSIDNPLLSITIPEGSTRIEIAYIAKKMLPTFDVQLFIENTKSVEGTLFPDTYYVSSEFTSVQLQQLLTDTFRQKSVVLQTALASSSLSTDEVVILASILEKEANDETSMKMVSGILQNRLRLQMPLQADATIGYVLQKPLKELVPTDLKIESPYNTYLHNGLPPTPISNPGLQALKAVLEPTVSDYYYYITDTQGQFHYAKTFDQHKRNIELYLK